MAVRNRISTDDDEIEGEIILVFPSKFIALGSDSAERSGQVMTSHVMTFSLRFILFIKSGAG